MTMSQLVSFVRDAHWLNRERVVAWSIVLLIEEALLLVFLALWQNGVLVDIDVPTSIDFVSFYAAGKLALAGTPALAYDHVAHYLAQQQATAPGAPYQFFYYPPVFLLICTALACLPYLVAYAVSQIVTLALFIGVIRCVLREKDWTWIPPVLAFPAVFWNLGLGQNAFLTAALFGGFTLLIDRRPMSAGMLLGMLCYKPHFGLLTPFALIAGRHWHAFFAAAAMTVCLVSVSFMIFGWETWAAYFAAFSASDAVYSSGRVDFAGMITPFGAVRLLGFNPSAAYIAQGIAALLMAGLIVVVWRRRLGRPLRSASLLAATLLAVPMALLYDKMLALVAIAWLVREAREDGFLPWEKIMLAAAYPLSLLTWTIGSAWHLPMGPLVSVMVLTLCLRRVWAVLASEQTAEQKTAALPAAVPSRAPIALEQHASVTP